MTRSERIVRIPLQYKSEMNDIMIDQQGGNEIICIGAGNIEYSGNTQELHAMKYKEAMKTNDKDKWIQAVNEEHG
jgi:hypothetical protein